MRYRLSFVVAAYFAVWLSTFAFAQQPSTTANCSLQPITLPGSLSELSGPLFADAGINDAGAIVGSYAPPENTNTNRGFLLYRGELFPFEFPGSNGTVTLAINNQSQIVGYYMNNRGGPHGFLVHSGGFQTIDMPGASSTLIFDINNAGAMVGQAVRTDGLATSFLFYRGRFSTFNFPSALPGTTAATGINDNSVIVGSYLDNLSHSRGFMVRNGTFAKLDFPGAADTAPAKINNKGVVVGEYFGFGPGGSHGFIYAQGKFTSVDFPGAVETSVVGVNNFSQILGWEIPVGGGIKLFQGDCKGVF